MENLAKLSYDCYDTLQGVRSTFLTQSRAVLAKGDAVLPEGVHIPLELKPFCFEDYRCDRFRLVKGQPHLTVFLGPDNERCDISLKDLDFPDLMSVMEGAFKYL